MKKFLFIGLAVLVALLGCNMFSRDFYRTAEDFPENGKGMLVLVLDGTDVANHNIAPSPATMTIKSYLVSGTHATAAPFTNDATNTSVWSRNNMAPGDWTLEVAAYNDLDGTGNRIGYGTKTITVLPNKMISETLDVGPEIVNASDVSYTGNLFLQFLWDANAVPNPDVIAILSAGTPETEGIANLGDQFTISDTTHISLPVAGVNLHAGYYTLDIQLLNGGEEILHDVQSVRIVRDLLTSGTWDLSGSTGDATVTITPDLNNPHDIDLDTSLWVSQKKATASLSDTPTGFFTYEWYEDGVLKQPIGGWITAPVATTTNSYTSVSTFTAGTQYRLSVVVTEYALEDITSDIIQISSLTFAFTP